MGKSRRISSTSYMPLPPEAPSPSYLDPFGVQGHVHVPALDLYLVLRYGLYSRQCLGSPGLHIEPGAVERTFDLRAHELAFAEVGELVGTDILEGVELTVHVAQGHGAVIHQVLLDLPRTNLVCGCYLVEL